MCGSKFVKNGLNMAKDDQKSSFFMNLGQQNHFFLLFPEILENFIKRAQVAGGAPQDRRES